MKNLFKNKKQKTVWIICVLLILLNADSVNNAYDATAGFFSYISLLISFIAMSLILTAVMQDK